MKWQFDNKRPIYLQIVEELQKDLLSGVYPPSSKFPTVRELAVEASVNPNTMLKALQLLEAEGYLCSQRTTGRVVTDDLSKITQKKRDKIQEVAENFLTEMEDLGYTWEASGEYVMELIQKRDEKVRGD